MKPFLRTLGFVILPAIFSGCIESTTMVEVKTDGSGTIRVLEFYSPQIMSMLEGFPDEMHWMEMPQEHEDDTHRQADASGLFQEQIMAKLMEYGPGVTLDSFHETTNARGWKGFEAMYAFSDINQIRLGGGDISETNDDALQYSFQFTPGETATLRIIPARPDTAAQVREREPMDEDDFHMTETPDMDDQEMLNGMEGLFGDLFQGMRVRMRVQVDGTVVESNADYPAPGRDNLITLMDVEFDRFLNDPEAMQLLMSEDPDAMYKLKEKGVPGIQVEDPDKTIVIRFR